MARAALSIVTDTCMRQRAIYRSVRIIEALLPSRTFPGFEQADNVAAAGYNKRHKLRALTSREAFGQYDYYRQLQLHAFLSCLPNLPSGGGGCDGADGAVYENELLTKGSRVCSRQHVCRITGISMATVQDSVERTLAHVISEANCD